MLTDPSRYDYLPLIDRPIIRWPENARVAFWVVPNIEFYEINPPMDRAARCGLVLIPTF
jgi:allantoinase